MPVAQSFECKTETFVSPSAVRSGIKTQVCLWCNNIKLCYFERCHQIFNFELCLVENVYYEMKNTESSNLIHKLKISNLASFCSPDPFNN